MKMCDDIASHPAEQSSGTMCSSIALSLFTGARPVNFVVLCHAVVEDIALFQLLIA
jgi:hypothetical protein